MRSFVIVTLLFVLSLQSLTTYHISQSMLETIEKQYGKKAKQRFVLWDGMLQEAKDKKILEQLKAVNDFFNQVKYLAMA